MLTVRANDRQRRIGIILGILVVLALALIALAAAFIESRQAFTRRDEGVPRAAEGAEGRGQARSKIRVEFASDRLR